MLHVNYVQSTCTECMFMLCYVILCLLCYAIMGCCVVPCPKNFSAQSDPVSFCASDNKRLVTCKYTKISGMADYLTESKKHLGVGSVKDVSSVRADSDSHFGQS